MLDLLNTAATGTRVTIGHCRRREHKRKRTGCLLPRRTEARAAKRGPEIVLNELILNNIVVILSNTCSFRKIKSSSRPLEKKQERNAGDMGGIFEPTLKRAFPLTSDLFFFIIHPCIFKGYAKKCAAMKYFVENVWNYKLYI